MSIILIFAAGLVVGLVAMRLFGGRGEKAAQTPQVVSDALPAPAPETAAQSPQDRLQTLKSDVEAQDERIQSPSDLTRASGFQDGVELLAGEDFRPEQLMEYLIGPGYVLPSMAAVALGRRNDADAAKVAASAGHLGAYPLAFVLDYLQTQPDAALLTELLPHGRNWWWDYGPFRQRFRAYLHWTAEHPPAESAPARFVDTDETALAELAQLFKRFEEPALQPFLQQLEQTISQTREHRVLKEIGRTEFRAPASARIEHEQLQEQLARLYEWVAVESKPTLVVGETGVGKSVLIEWLSERLHAEGWLVFEASAADILAGQKYIGELEGRIRQMVGVLHRKRALWRVPDFFDLLAKGSHSHDPRGILDLVMPAIERGELLLVGEIAPSQYAQLLLARPGIKHRFEALRVEPATDAALDGIAARWAQAAEIAQGRSVAGAEALTEARRLAAHYFPEQQEPGRLLRLLNDALRIAVAEDPALLPMDGDLLIAAIAARTGLPLDVIDDRRSLDLSRLRAFFLKRVIGQDEAVDALLDRIAMLKAGLADANRPIGVFLFAGPTGTGKTELAKALGELLFGNSDRLLRLDMSEYQSPDAAQRLLAGGRESGAKSLTARVREQPFSVVLLDEFEKAHPNVWDLFLQVFDDARLSDDRGNHADFRHSIIILTSNAGAAISRGGGPGFVGDRGGYSRSAVEKALYETFRREFLNRIDRVVIFNPLDRALMRNILHKELERVLDRRGFRSRGWTVEWEPSAVEFLLDRGFTPDLGARPLRRAIEHHLLAPLARSIVEHRAPEGDQFLFVRSAGDRLDVEFIDPDTPSAPALREASPDAPHDLRTLLFAAADGAPIEPLRDSLRTIGAALEGEAWIAARENDYAAMSDAAFWSDAGRFAVLDRIERRDRIESAFDTAERMLERHQKGRGDAPAGLVQLLFLLDLAVRDLQEQRPQDAILSVAATQSELGRNPAEIRLWWQRLLRMYLEWAKRRNMRVQILQQDAAHCRAQLAVSGFGAFTLLEGEHGLHVLESDESGDARRVTLQVAVQPHMPGDAPAWKEGDPAHAQHVCRRYRESPSPLVRDTRAGWRSGRLDRVLDGDFDVMQ